MKIVCGIYKITSPSGKIYIGQSVNILRRWRGYYNFDSKKNRKLHSSFKKYGVENHKFEIIEECSVEYLNEREIYWVKFYDTFNTKHGLNLKSGGSQGGACSEETKNKISKSHKGKKMSHESIVKNRIAHTGKTLTEEHKNKISRKMKGRIFSDEWRQKISDNKKGKPGWNKGKIGRET